MNQIHELLEKIAEAVKAEFPDATTATFSLDPFDGYRSISVEKREINSDLPIEEWKRRELFSQYTFGDDWSQDASGDLNRYYKEHNLLLEV